MIIFRFTFLLLLTTCSLYAQPILSVVYEKNYGVAGQGLEFYYKVFNLPEGTPVTYRIQGFSFDLPQSNNYGVYKFYNGSDDFDASRTKRKQQIIEATFNLNNKPITLRDTLVYYLLQAEVNITPPLNGTLYLNCRNTIKVELPEIDPEDYNPNLVAKKDVLITRDEAIDVFHLIPQQSPIKVMVLQGGCSANLLLLNAIEVPDARIKFSYEKTSSLKVTVSAQYPEKFSALCPADASIKSVQGEVYILRAGKKIFTTPYSHQNNYEFDFATLQSTLKENDVIGVEINQVTRINYEKKEVVQKLKLKAVTKALY